MTAEHMTKVKNLLFGKGDQGDRQGPGPEVYAVLDGASVRKNVATAAGEHGAECRCLFRGELDPITASRAPHVVKLSPDGSILEWILQEGWGKHWGIFARVPADGSIDAIRRHFRKFYRVKLPDGSVASFRYYDPRILSIYLPACDPEERSQIFGSIWCYYAETKDASQLQEFNPNSAQPIRHTL